MTERGYDTCTMDTAQNRVWSFPYINVLYALRVLNTRGGDTPRLLNDSAR